MDAIWAEGVQPLLFLKLNVNCWEKVFDYPSLRDILSMSQTCKRMQLIGGHYYRDNFRSERVGFSENDRWHSSAK